MNKKYDSAQDTMQGQDTRHAQEKRCRFLTYLYAGDPTFLEWVLGALKTAWGGWLLLPFHAFAAAPHLYRYVAAFPEWGWGCIMVFLGIAQWVCWDNLWQRGRFFTSMAGLILWQRLGWLMWEGDHRSVSLVILTILSAFQILAAALLYGKAFPSEADKERGYDQL